MTTTLSTSDRSPINVLSDRRRRAPISARTNTVVVHLLLIFFVIMAIGPVLLIVMNSFKTQMGIFQSPFSVPTADTFSFDGYITVFTQGDFGVYYLNSFVVTFASTALTVLLSTLAAFALVEYKVRLTPILTAFFIVGIMLPVRLGTVSVLEMMVSWNLTNTLTALILVYTGMSLPLAVALLTTYFRSVPGELKEAAKIDGAGEVRVLSIIFPLIRPGLAAVASITMLPLWNDLWFPLILAPSTETMTVTLGVQQFVGEYQNNWPALLAALTLGAIPLIALFMVFSKQFIKGLSEGYSR